jgi:8-oxo-dGTP pyrophosphatase MutT (NUDIX family)
VGEYKSVWTGTLWQAQQSLQPSGAVFERVLRIPGSRIIIVREGKVLLSIEKRNELGGKADHRLPGGKVFGTIDEFQQYMSEGKDIVEASRASIAREALEEVGVVVDPTKLIYQYVDVLGATCSWDLHYWATEDFEFHADGAQFQETEAEEIEGFVWLSFADACKLALDKTQFSESRSAIALLTYASSKGYVKVV